jgi:hypothetical protein
VSSSIPPELIRAYTSTVYTAYVGEQTFHFHIGERCGEADAWLASHLPMGDPGLWVHITACNPRSRWLSADENARRMERLRADLAEIEGIFWFEGEGRGLGPHPSWAEPGFWVVSLSQEQAVLLANRYEQNAIVVGRRNQPARLLLMK